MKFRHRPAWLTAASLAILLFAGATVSSQRPAPAGRGGGGRPQTETLVINVGVISYNSYASGLQRYGDELRELSKAYKRETGAEVAFKLAIGSYSDVLDWYNRELVDVAFLTPQPLAELRAALRNPNAPESGRDDELKRRYIATHATNAGPRPAFEYNAVCMVGKNTPINDVGELKELAAKGQISFLFVDPLSLSGRILPEHLLRSDELGITNIKVNPTTLDEGINGITYTYSRSSSIAALVEEEDQKLDSLFVEDDLDNLSEDFAGGIKHPVAFFYEADIPEEYKAKLKKVSFPALESKKLPEEVLLATPSFLEHSETLRLVFRVDRPGSFFRSNPYGQARGSWIDRFDEVSQWVEALGVNSRDPHNQMFTIERIGKMLRNYETQRGRPARLALVLSGGGAKCAYQLGAIRVIESEIAVPPESEQERPVDIDLVVGTSGGAINALTVALGLTRDGEDQKYLESNLRLAQTWEEFRQKHFFSPYPVVYYLLALATALLQAVLLTWLFVAAVFVGMLFGRELSWLYRYLGLAMVALALVNLLAQWGGWDLQSRGTHLWQHLSLLFTFHLYLTALCLAVIGLLMTALLLRRKEHVPWFRAAHALTRNALLFVVVGLIFYSLFVAKTLSEESLVESTLAERITRLANPEAGAKLATADKSEGQLLLSKLSDDYLTPLLERDLIITGSRLPEDEQGGAAAAAAHRHAELPPDIYFFHDNACQEAKRDPSLAAMCDPNVPADGRQSRFHPFVGESNHLLDVVIGSSSIYPIFPSRPLKDLGRIVDGGFAHNSPIEAAVLWKATHIILIEASPLTESYEGHLWQNAQNAFNHLYFQAQLSDLRARGKVEMFTLRPEAPQRKPGTKLVEETDGKPEAAEEEETGDGAEMCTFDFDPKSIRAAIRRGKEDAENTAEPRFERVHGEPVFEEVVLERAPVQSVACPCPKKPPANGTTLAGID